MRWFKRKTKAKAASPPEPDGMTPGPYAAYWWVPGCTCHFMAGIESDYCDFCKSRWLREAAFPPESLAT